jgi:hypothetical protein
MEKKCLKCDIVKNIDFFSKDKSRKDGRHPYCKECVKIVSKPYFDSHKEEAIERTREWTLNNKERQEEYNSREDVKLRKKEYMTQYRKTHKERKRETSRQYEAKRSKEDIEYKILNSLRKRLGSAIRGNQKSGSAIKDLGCSISQFRAHIESLFQPGMTWDNWGLGYGKWQLDHKEALCLFDLTDREQFLKANHYTNLQPMWYEDHLIKTESDFKIKKERCELK